MKNRMEDSSEKHGTDEKTAPIGQMEWIDPAKLHFGVCTRRNCEEDSLAALAESIRCYGILQPLIVRRTPGAAPAIEGTVCGQTEDGTHTYEVSECSASYEVIDGARRLRAAIMAGQKKIPCLILNADDKQSAAIALLDNMQRESLDMFELAGTIAAWMELYAMTQEQAARHLSLSQSYVANKLRLLKLTPKEREQILDHHLTERHARALLKIERTENRCKVLEEVIRCGMNVAQTEDYVEKCLTEGDYSSFFPHGNDDIILLKDLRFFFHTLDRALETLKRAGVCVEQDCTETKNETEIRIRIRKAGETEKTQPYTA